MNEPTEVREDETPSSITDEDIDAVLFGTETASILPDQHERRL